MIPKFINEVKGRARIFVHPQQRKGLLWTITLTAKQNEFLRIIYVIFVNEIIITIFINCNWVVTRWQWLFYVYTKHEIGY